MTKNVSLRLAIASAVVNALKAAADHARRAAISMTFPSLRRSWRSHSSAITSSGYRVDLEVPSEPQPSHHKGDNSG